MLVAANPLIEVRLGLMVWTIVCFGITFYVLKRFAFGAIQKIIDERRERIRSSIEQAEKARSEARRLLEEHRALIGQARGQAEQILAEARKVAETKRQIEAETQRALHQIRAEVAELTLIATAKVTGKVLDESDHKRLIEDAISDLDFSALEHPETVR
jgi:F-type H+-transporting ATPase subunit b